MTQDRIIEMAREAGFNEPEVEILKQEITSFAAFVRAHALEEAEGVCDVTARYEDWEILGGAEGKALCNALAAAIRNLKGQP